jgi:outer membrane protein assembly factor BamD
MLNLTRSGAPHLSGHPLVTLHRCVRIVALALAVMVAGCSGTPKGGDPTEGFTAEKLYKEARQEVNGGNWDQAVPLLEKLEARFPFGILAQQAQLDIAYVYYRQGERAQALSAIERFLKLHPNHPVADYALYLRGVVQFNDNLGLFSSIAAQDPSERDQQSMRDSFDAFKELVTRFPDSTYSPDARSRMQFIRNAIARYEVHVARYYLRRGVYLAAANRAQKAITEFDQTPALEEALVVMVQAYDALGLAQLKTDTERVYKASFPQGKMLAAGLPTDVKPFWKLW